MIRLGMILVLAALPGLISCRTPPSPTPAIGGLGFSDDQWMQFFVGTLDSRLTQTRELPQLHICDTLATRVLSRPERAARLQRFVDTISFGEPASCKHPLDRKARLLLVLTEVHFDSKGATANLFARVYGSTYWIETWHAELRGRRFFLPWTITMTVAGSID